MEFELKAISPEAVARALAKAERYRLLNEPGEAESICRDVLQVETDNQEALTMLLLALTEQFHDDASTVADARGVVGRLRDEYGDRRRAPRQGAAPAWHARLRPTGL